MRNSHLLALKGGLGMKAEAWVREVHVRDRNLQVGVEWTVNL